MPGLLSVDERNRMLTRTVYMTEDQQRQLRELAARTGRSVAAVIREGIDLVLDHHRTVRRPHGFGQEPPRGGAG